jgi:hypothetical protein
MKALNLQDFTEDKIFGLIYGASGTGKTHLIGTLAELGSVLVVDIDKGSKTLKYAPTLKNCRESGNIVVVNFERFGDLDTLYKLSRENNPAKWSTALGVQIDKPFDWIVADTWSEIQWNMTEELRSKDSDLKGTGINYRKNIGIQHWGMITDLNKLSIESFRTIVEDQVANIVFTMQEKMEKDELSGQIYGGPAIHGKLVQEVPAYFDVVVHTTTDLGGNYCATTKSKGKWPGKTRLGVGGEYKNPTA